MVDRIRVQMTMTVELEMTMDAAAYEKVRAKPSLISDAKPVVSLHFETPIFMGNPRGINVRGVRYQLSTGF